MLQSKDSIVITIVLSFLCLNIYSQNCSNTSTGRPPINDLGTGYWHGAQGGLYPNGLNTRPVAHNNGGLQMAAQILPLDTNGVYDPVNGKVVWLSVGMSNTTMETQVFIPLTDTFQNKNTKLVLIDGAQGGQDINIILDTNANFWNVIVTRLRQRGLSTKQVQAVWFKEAEISPSDTSFPGYAMSLKNKFKTVMNILKNKYRNVKLCYISSRIYAGYATGALNPEPYAYYSGWSVKWLIQDQINGDTNLIYTGNNPKSPWLSWGPYPWADGLVPRSDGLIWVCPGDYQPDGVHPSVQGRRKVANMLFQFFTTDQTTVSWFLQNPLGIKQIESEVPEMFVLHQNYPNPFNPATKIRFDIPSVGQRHAFDVLLNVYDVLGREVSTIVNEQLNPGIYEVVWDASNYPSGVYFYKLMTEDYISTKKMILNK